MKILHNLISKVKKSDKDQILTDKNIRVGFEFEFLGPIPWSTLTEYYEEYFYSSAQSMPLFNLDAKDRTYFRWMTKEELQSTLLVSNIGESKRLQKMGYELIVPDASVSDDENDYEYITQPTVISEAISRLYTILNGISSPGFGTNDRCSLHVGISFRGINLLKDLDFVKLFMFLDEGKVYSKMPSRKGNLYTVSPVNPSNNKLGPTISVSSAIHHMANLKKIDLSDLDKALPRLLPHFKMSKANKSALMMVLSKYASVNLTKLEEGYLEFRLLGGHNYPKQYQFIRSTILDFAYVIKLACSRDKEELYLKKLKRFMLKEQSTVPARTKDILQTIKDSL